MIRLIIAAFISTLVSTPSFAHESKHCQPLLMGSFEALVKYGLEYKLMDTSDLERLLKADRPANPFGKNGLGSEKAKLRAAFEKLVERTPITEWQGLKERLSVLIAQNRRSERQTSDARELTRRVLAPKEIYRSPQLPSNQISSVINKIAWKDTDLLTLQIELRGAINPTVQIYDGLRIETKGIDPEETAAQLGQEAEQKVKTLELINGQFPNLNSTKVTDLRRLHPNFTIAFARARSGNNAYDIFLIKGHQVFHAGQVTHMIEVRECDFIPPSFVDCVVRRTPHSTYLRIAQNHALQVVDLEFTARRSPLNLSLTHLADGTPLIASSHHHSGVEIFRPLDGSRAFRIISTEARSVNWINVDGQEIYLVATGETHDVLFEPLLEHFPLAKLPYRFGEGRTLVSKTDDGQVYAVSYDPFSYMITKLYSEKKNED